MEATAEKSTLSEQRAQKKAARRAAFIQEVAEAVYNLSVQRQRELEAKRRQRDQAASQAQLTQQKLADATLAATSPIEALYCKNHDVQESIQWYDSAWPATRAERALSWAIKCGILSEGTPQLPDAEAQFLALAPWQLKQQA
jgi:hypothetical protein